MIFLEFINIITRNKKNKLILSIVSLLLFVILLGQFNLPTTDFSSSSNIEIELSNEELDDNILLSVFAETQINYYLYDALSQATPHQSQSRFYLRPNTRAPPTSNFDFS